MEGIKKIRNIINKGNWISEKGMGILGFLVLVCISVTLVLNFRPLYYMDMKLLDIPGQSGYEESLIKENYDILITYNNITYGGKLNFKDLPMSETAKIHFLEVKRLFGLFEWCAIIGGTIFVIQARIMWKKRRFRWLKYTAVSSIAIPLVLGVFVLSNWEAVFIGFHRLVFRNDYWLFDPQTDPIITMLPDEFFSHCAALIIACVLAGSVVCYCLYKRQSRKYNVEKYKRRV